MYEMTTLECQVHFFLFHEASDNWVNQDASHSESQISRVLFTMEIYRRKTLA